MTEDLKRYLYVLFSKLSLKERGEIIAHLKGMILNSDISLQDAICKFRGALQRRILLPALQQQEGGKVWPLP
jgi:hypothetical protein